MSAQTKPAQPASPTTPGDAPPLTITTEAAARLRREADFTTAVLSVRHLLGCGGTGFRISVEENTPDEGHRFEASGIPVVMDEHAFRKLRGAVLEVDPDPAGDGYRLDHPDAVMTTFC
jgi:Fe-S cluster assembly iron-binding protein IscA